MSIAAQTGKLPMPQPDEAAAGGHAALAVGSDDSTQEVTVKFDGRPVGARVDTSFCPIRFWSANSPGNPSTEAGDGCVGVDGRFVIAVRSI